MLTVNNFKLIEFFFEEIGFEFFICFIVLLRNLFAFLIKILIHWIKTLKLEIGAFFKMSYLSLFHLIWILHTALVYGLCHQIWWVNLIFVLIRPKIIQNQFKIILLLPFIQITVVVINAISFARLHQIFLFYFYIQILRINHGLSLIHILFIIDNFFICEISCDLTFFFLDIVMVNGFLFLQN